MGQLETCILRGMNSIAEKMKWLLGSHEYKLRTMDSAHSSRDSQKCNSRVISYCWKDTPRDEIHLFLHSPLCILPPCGSCTCSLLGEEKCRCFVTIIYNSRLVFGIYLYSMEYWKSPFVFSLQKLYECRLNFNFWISFNVWDQPQ